MARKGTKVVRWSDVPADRRVDRDYYLRFSRFYVGYKAFCREMASHAYSRDEWDTLAAEYHKSPRSPDEEAVAERLRAHVDASLCAAAVPAYASGGRYDRCQYVPVAGDEFCSMHGGAKKTPARRPRTQVLRQIALAAAKKRLAKLEQQVAEVKSKIAALEE